MQYYNCLLIILSIISVVIVTLNIIDNFCSIKQRIKKLFSFSTYTTFRKGLYTDQKVLYCKSDHTECRPAVIKKIESTMVMIYVNRVNRWVEIKEIFPL